MRRAFRLIAFGLAGILVTAGLTAAAFAVAGKDIAEPANPIGIFRTPETAPSEPGNAGGDNGNGKDQTKAPPPTQSPHVSGGGTSTSTGTPTGTASGGSLGSSPSSEPSPSGDSGDSGSGDSGSGDSGGDHHPDD